ncbi:TRAP transporter substrate-binding protein [Pseudolabrys sp. FHR47]|uniref:TRAP transporter substrate-binding protein n=1 Tax=Pseudolabrys sp. FHR47 TaxID=2562284 RepID=UPI0010BF56DA|nr:TRAP transporter substrate-binding protein [Pseudolabrys sp. FHR47]
MKIRMTLLALLLSAAPLMSASAAEVVLKASHNANATEPYNLGLERMNEILKKKTGDKAEIKIFPNAQLGDEKESIQGTQLGTIDIAVTANETLVNFVPDLSVFSMPFLFGDAAQMNRALADPAVRDDVNKILAKKGFHLLGFFSAGTRHIMTKKPIKSIADLHGMKIRTMQNPAHIAAFKDFGANPTPLAYSELYGALQTGVVDGAEAANTNYFSKKFYEVAPDWALLGWLELVAPVIMGEQRFQALPKNVQVALTDAANEASAYQRKVYLDSDNKLFDELVKQGVKVTKPDPAPFRAAAEKVYAGYITTDGQKELFKLIKAVK